MKIAFTGDLSFFNIDNYTDTPFNKIVPFIKKIKLVINLETIFLPSNCRKMAIKTKICLKQASYTLKYLQKLHPLLINLSNNHINDYGNFGAEYTKKLLSSKKIPSFGAGFLNQTHNIFVLKKQKIMFLAYTTQETDLSGSKLFNEVKFIGPKELSVSTFKNQTMKYIGYKKIVLIHWGLEQKKYPSPEQRKIARELINAGSDLIIGSHSHTIQGYELYCGKYIFYSLGNFLFPHVQFTIFRKKYSHYQAQKNRESILPIFSIGLKKIKLDNIYLVKSNKKFELRLLKLSKEFFKEYNPFFNQSIEKYSFFYIAYSIKEKIVVICYFFPYLIYKHFIKK